ncbi:MAG: response regulator [Cyclobacteriaceae bacterium]|nr:response regulator [Cyclobacteriaceae bacterium]
MEMRMGLKILVLEDMYEDVELIERVLRKDGFDFTTRQVDTREEFELEIRTFLPDVVLSDHGLPQFSSTEALQLCKENGFTGVFILVTGTVSEEFAVSCIKQGADDYVLKSNLSRLPSSINNSLQKRDTEKKRLNAEIALREQNEELIKINKELDSFVYSVSHNLRAPLMSVLGLLNLAKNEGHDPDQHFGKYFNMMEQSIHKLDDTLKEILEYSRNARNEVYREQVDIKAIVEENMERLRYLDGYNELTKNLEVIADVPAFSDAYRLSVIFNNLLSNAIKYRNSSRLNSYINITVRVSEAEIKIEFIDNGIGIKDELLPKIFNMFFRASTVSDGAGLGLYIVKETVEKLNGTIDVKSELDVGTSFSILLPNSK